MATVEVTDESLTVHVTGVDRILAFKSTITVPLAHHEHYSRLVVGVDDPAATVEAVRAALAKKSST